jgi:hypothetical protein
MKECFGKIYPDLSVVDYNKVLAGLNLGSFTGI